MFEKIKRFFLNLRSVDKRKQSVFQGMSDWYDNEYRMVREDCRVWEEKGIATKEEIDAYKKGQYDDISGLKNNFIKTLASIK